MSEVGPSKEGQIMDVGKGNDGDHPDDAVPTDIQVFRQFLYKLNKLVLKG